jgi:F-type H+-transporting ATPase subunit a
VTKSEPLAVINLLGIDIGITSSIIIQWIIILLTAVLSILFTKNLKKIPDKKQTMLEIFVDTANNMVRQNMGDNYMGFVPFIGSLMVYLVFMNIVPLFGFRAPTEDISVTLGIALVTFFIIQFYTIKKIGLLHYFTGFSKPIAALTPINVIERVMLPVSLCLRLFGNITAGAVIMELLYEALGHLSWIAQLAIPVPIHFYFDLFDGVLQMIIFVMLTMINIKVISEH